MKLRKLISLPFVLGIAVGAFGMRAGADMLGSAVFGDVPAGSYFDGAVGRLYGAGIVKGTNGMFKPGDFVTRADVAVMIDRALNGGDLPAVSSSSRSSRSRSSSSESSSSVSVSSSSSSVATVGEAGAFRFAVEKVSIPEASTNVTLTVIRYSGKKGSATVSYKTSDGTATAGSDYNEATGTVSFADGETSKNISLKFINDLGGEAAESFNVTLSDPTNGTVLGTPVTAVITILDNDGGPGGGSTGGSSSSAGTTTGDHFSFSAWGYSVPENAGSATITVLRKGSTTAPASIKYATTDGSAKSGTDYGAAQGQLDFAAGETSKTFTVSVTDNSSIEGNRNLTLKLSNSTGPAIGNPNNVQLTVVDNEANSGGSGSVLFSAETYTVREKDGTATINVYRRTGFAGTVTVKYATTDSTATGGSDYTSVTGTLTFAPYENNKSFSIPVHTDNLTENEEKVNLTLSEAGNAVLGSPSTAVLKISD